MCKEITSGRGSDSGRGRTTRPPTWVPKSPSSHAATSRKNIMSSGSVNSGRSETVETSKSATSSSSSSRFAQFQSSFYRKTSFAPKIKKKGVLKKELEKQEGADKGAFDTDIEKDIERRDRACPGVNSIGLKTVGRPFRCLLRRIFRPISGVKSSWVHI